MAGLAGGNAASLLESARREGRLESCYLSAMELLKTSDLDTANLPQELQDFLHALPAASVRPTLSHFLELAREDLKIVNVEVVSAVPLKSSQLADLERAIVKNVKKRVNIRTSVDPAIVGGLRVLIDNYVVDSSIKTQLEQLRESLHKGVYFQHENEPL